MQLRLNYNLVTNLFILNNLYFLLVTKSKIDPGHLI